MIGTILASKAQPRTRRFDEAGVRGPLAFVEASERAQVTLIPGALPYLDDTALEPFAVDAVVEVAAAP